MLRPKGEVPRYFVLLLLAGLPLFFVGLSNHGLWSADEPRVAEIGREMALNGNWAVPTLNQRPFLEEPPLYYGALAIAFKAAGGATDKVARIPSALFAFAAVIAVFWIAHLLFGPRVAFLSGFILATTGEYFHTAHWIVVDTALTFFVVCAMGLFIGGYLSGSMRKKLICYTLLYVSCSLAFLVKGFIGVVIPGLGVLTFVFVERNWKELVRMRLWLGVLIFLAITGPWFVALWQQGGAEHLREFLLINHLYRFLPGGTLTKHATGHHHPFYYYLTQFPVAFLPWAILLIPVLVRAFSKSRTPDQAADKGRLFAKCWFFAGFVFLCVASTKRALYLMPILAPIAMLTAVYIDSLIATKAPGKIDKFFLWIFALMLLVSALGMAGSYLYFMGTPLLGPSAGLAIVTFVTAALVVLLCIGALRYLIKGDIGKYWTGVGIALVALLMFVLTALVPILDRHKSFVPFCDKIAALVPANRILYSYLPDETLRGAVPFYTGRYMEELATPEQVRDLAGNEEQFFLVIRDKERLFEKELLATGKVGVVVRADMGTDRTLLLLSNKATGEPLRLKDPLNDWLEGKKDRERAPVPRGAAQGDRAAQ